MREGYRETLHFFLGGGHMLGAPPSAPSPHTKAAHSPCSGSVCCSEANPGMPEACRLHLALLPCPCAFLQPVPSALKHQLRECSLRECSLPSAHRLCCSSCPMLFFSAPWPGKSAPSQVVCPPTCIEASCNGGRAGEQLLRTWCDCAGRAAQPAPHLLAACQWLRCMSANR